MGAVASLVRRPGGLTGLAGLDEAREALLQKNSIREYRSAQAALARSINTVPVRLAKDKLGIPRIAELTQLKTQLTELRQRCLSARPDTEDCGILHGLSEMQVEERQERHTHLG